MSSLVAGASVGVDVFVEIIEVVVELLDPVGRALGRDLQLLLVVEVLGVPDLPGVEADPLLALLLLHAVVLVPDLERAAGHHHQALHVVAQPGALAARQRVQAAQAAAHLAWPRYNDSNVSRTPRCLLTLAAPGDDEVGVPGVAAVLVKQHGAGARDRALKHSGIVIISVA